MSPHSNRPHITELSERAQRDAEKMAAIFSVSGGLALAMLGVLLIQNVL